MFVGSHISDWQRPDQLAGFNLRAVSKSEVRPDFIKYAFHSALIFAPVCGDENGEVPYLSSILKYQRLTSLMTA